MTGVANDTNLRIRSWWLALPSICRRSSSSRKRVPRTKLIPRSPEWRLCFADGPLKMHGHTSCLELKEINRETGIQSTFGTRWTHQGTHRHIKGPWLVMNSLDISWDVLSRLRRENVVVLQCPHHPLPWDVYLSCTVRVHSPCSTGLHNTRSERECEYELNYNHHLGQQRQQ